MLARIILNELATEISEAFVNFWLQIFIFKTWYWKLKTHHLD